MTKLEREIDIAAPRERVYDVLADPSCLEKWVTIQEELEEAPAGDLTEGSTLRQRMKVAGARFHLTWRVVEADRPSRIVWEGRGPMRTKARAVYELSEDGEGRTRFGYLNEYTLPGGPAGRLAGGAISRAAGREADRTLERLRELIEGSSSGQ
jgi:uncharacterized protein YndB with AHSA1/START domain